MSPIPDTSLTGNENVRQQIANIASATGSTIQDVERSATALAEALAGERTGVTPAIQRAAEALAEHVGGPTQELEADGVPEMTVRQAEAHVTVAAALDVGEMHRVIVAHRIRKTEDVYDDTIVTCLCEAECSGYDGWRYHQASAMRDAILSGAS